MMTSGGQKAERRQRRLHELFRLFPRAAGGAALAFVVSIGATLWCGWAVGGGLGLFLGGILLLTLYLPALSFSAQSPVRWTAPVAASAGVGLVWLLATTTADVTWGEWLRCVLVLGAYAWCLTGISVLLNTVRIPAALAAGITLIIGLLWLTWPVWLSAWLTQALANCLVPANPLLAINGILRHLGTWDHGSLAYSSLTVLNQDIAYHLPRSIWPAVLLHLGLGSMPLGIPIVRRVAWQRVFENAGDSSGRKTPRVLESPATPDA
jgi:hypothetical protein